MELIGFEIMEHSESYEVTTIGLEDFTENGEGIGDEMIFLKMQMREWWCVFSSEEAKMRTLPKSWALHEYNCQLYKVEEDRKN